MTQEQEILSFIDQRGIASLKALADRVYSYCALGCYPKPKGIRDIWHIANQVYPHECRIEGDSQ